MAAQAEFGPTAQLSPEVQRLCHKVNLGAALLPGFWTLSHGAPALGVLFWLFFLPLPPIALGIMVYLFFNGNRVALERRIFRDPAEFEAVQRAWMIAGLIAIPFMLIVLFTVIAVVAALVSSDVSVSGAKG
jgi:hypothetical protein